MTKNEFIKEVARRGKFSNYAVEEMYNVSSNLIIENLINGNIVEVPNMGIFKISTKNGKNLFGDVSDNFIKYPIFKICNTIKNRVKNSYKH